MDGPTMLAVNGVELAIYERPGDGPAVLLAHANGFHARCWDQVIAALPGRRCLAVDLRGHGQSSKPSPPYRWRDFGADLAAAALALELRGAVGVGHSLGGHAVTLAAALAPDTFARLVLLDPVIFPRAHYDQPAGAGFAFVARRRNQWASADEMFARFRDRLPFSRWQPAVLRDYCQHGLVPDPSGDGWVLACPPAIEADVYRGLDADIYPDLAAVTATVQVVRAAPPHDPAVFDLSSSPTAPDLAAHFRRATDELLADCSHFIPMEVPALVAQRISAAV